MSKSNRGSRLGCILFSIVSVVILLCIALGVVLYLSMPKATLPGLWVNLVSPQLGTTAEVNTPILVSATAGHSSGVTDLELYADGALVAAQASPAANGTTPFLFAQTWTPTTAGRHVLIARAYAADNSFADSNLVYVDVVPLLDRTVPLNVDNMPHPQGGANPSPNQIATTLHVPVDQIIAANPNLGGRDPNAPLPDGSLVEIPRSSPSSPPPPPPSPDTSGGSGDTSGGPRTRIVAPAPPTNLAGTADCSSVQLTWTDSPAEEQYVVYRIGPDDSTRVPVATLAQNTTSYRDTIPGFGEYRYQVASVRAHLEGFTPIITVIPPGTCVPPWSSSDTTDLTLTLISIETQEQYDGLYCYVAIDGSPVERAPHGDFDLILADPGRVRFDLQRQLPNHGQYMLRHRSIDPFTMQAVCYGARGATRLPVSTVTASNPAADWNGRELQAGTAFMRLRYRIGNRSALADLRTPREIVPVMPVPANLRRASGFDICLDSGGSITDCLGVLGNYIRWDWNGGAAFREDGITGYRAILTIYDLQHLELAGTELRRWEVRGGRTKWTPQPILPAGMTCGYRVKLEVQAYVITPGTGAGTLDSYWSEPLRYDLPSCTREPNVRVTVRSLTFGPSTRATVGTFGTTPQIQDNEYCDLVECLDHRVEVSGWLHITGLSTLFGHNVAPRPVAPFGACPAGLFCTQGGTYGVASTRHSPWDINVSSSPGPGDSISVNIGLYDNDFLTGPQPLCIGNTVFASRSALEWQRTDETRVITSDYGEASCRVEIRVQGSPLP